MPLGIRRERGAGGLSRWRSPHRRAPRGPPWLQPPPPSIGLGVQLHVEPWEPGGGREVGLGGQRTPCPVRGVGSGCEAEGSAADPQAAWVPAQLGVGWPAVEAGHLACVVWGVLGGGSVPLASPWAPLCHQVPRPGETGPLEWTLPQRPLPRAPGHSPAEAPSGGPGDPTSLLRLLVNRGFRTRLGRPTAGHEGPMCPG